MQSVMKIPVLFLLSVAQVFGQPIRSGDDAQKLVKGIEKKLDAATRRQVNRIEQGTGKTFEPSKRLMRQQEDARTVLYNKVLSQLTKKVDTTLNGQKARMRVVDWQKISALSAQQLSQCLERLAQTLRMLPPVGSPDEWAKVIAPLISFDQAAQEGMTSMVSMWLDKLLENKQDLLTLARISTENKEQQHERIAQLRKRYVKQYHNASQLLYPWIQIALLLDSRDPWGAWLEYATTQPQALQGKFKQLLGQAQQVLQDIGRESASEADARGLVLLAIASLFAPEEIFAQLKDQRVGSTD